MIAISALKCYQNKSADGVHWIMTAYFLGWGIWNLPYYMSLEQSWSLKAAAITAFMNVVYTGLLIKYTFFKKPVDSVSEFA